MWCSNPKETTFKKRNNLKLNPEVGLPIGPVINFKIRGMSKYYCKQRLK